jgi:hypothetical protein
MYEGNLVTVTTECSFSVIGDVYSLVTKQKHVLSSMIFFNRMDIVKHK